MGDRGVARGPGGPPHKLMSASRRSFPRLLLGLLKGNSGSHDRAIQPAVIPTAATGALVGELGGELLVQLDSQARAIVGIHVPPFDLGAAGKYFLRGWREDVLLLDPEVGAGQIQ